MSKIAVVTGSSKGIGEAISKKLLNKNYKVYGISRTEPRISSANFHWIKADLTKEKSIQDITMQLVEDNIDILVNNAGTAIEEDYLKFTDENFKKIFGINFVAPIKLTLSLLPKLSKGLS